MSRPTEEQLFDRYRCQGDVEALGEVFDRTAPALLRVALHLAKDPPGAEDLVQATFLKAIESATDWSADRPLLPWLVGILRHQGQQARWRDGRRPDPTRMGRPGTHDPEAKVQELELTEALDAAIAVLPEPYRPVLRLRLGYGHEPAEIAHALDRPPATVRGQLARGLELLRRKLPSGFATAPGIAPFPGRGLAAVKAALLEVATEQSVVAAIAPFSVGALIMKKTLGVVLVVLMACGVWFAWPGDANPSTPPTDERGREDRGSVSSPPAEENAEEAAITRVAVPQEAPAPSDPKLGTVLVRVRWRDGKPAPGVAVVLNSSRPIYHVVVRRLTDEQGVVQFGALRPGKFEVSTHRGGQTEVVATAGKVAEAVIELKGVDVHGVVVDAAGSAVVDAGIWITGGYRRDWQGGRVVTRSDSRGEFRIRGVPSDQCLGALAMGFAPSDLVDLDEVDTTKVPVDVRVVVRDRGGAVTGVVRSPSGEPVPGADVCVGKQPRRFQPRRGSAGRVETWTPLGTTTDDDGRFELPGVALGEHPVAVRATGMPIWNGAVVVRDGETSNIEVQLLDGVVIHGVVTDGVGQPIGGAVVRAYDKKVSVSFIQGGQFDYESVFGFPFAGADDEGRYRMTGVAPGSIHLYATRPWKPRHGTVMRAKAVMEGDAGEEVLWNPTIEVGLSISGLVIYKNGTPMRHCFINLRCEKTDEVQSLTTDREGRFRFTNLESASYKVWVQYPWQAPKGTPALAKGGVWPDTGEVRLVASFDLPDKKPSGSVHGRIDDAGGRRLHGLAFGVILNSDKSWVHRGKAEKDGSFEFKDVRPGRVRLVVMAGEHQVLTSAWFDVAPAQKHDAGTLVTEPGGAFRIRLRREKGAENLEPLLLATHQKTGQRRAIWPGVSADHVERNLSVGAYEIRVSGKGIPRTTVAAKVKAGQAAVVGIPLRRGLPRSFSIKWPEDAGRLDLVIQDEGGGVVWEVSFELSVAFPNPYKPVAYLPPGRYTVKVTTANGYSAEQTMEVRIQEKTAPVTHITLKSAK